MSNLRGIWSDGSNLATADLQRVADSAGSADDRALEALFASAAQKSVFPLTDENNSTNPRLISVPSGSGQIPAGINGAVRIMPLCFVAADPTNNQRVLLSGTSLVPVDSNALGANVSGINRFDLVYASLTRQVTVSAARRIKSAVDGSVSSQTINLADAPTITINVIAGFLTGGTPPTAAQIASALPADTTTSFNVALCYVTVATAYSVGTPLTQSQITQCWPGGFVPSHRIRGLRPMSMFTGAANERANAPSFASQAANAARWGSDQRLMVYFKLLSTTPNLAGGGVVLDTTLDYRGRLVWGWMSYLGSANTQWPLETNVATSGIRAQGFAGFAGGSSTTPLNLNDQISFGPAFTGGGSNTGNSIAAMGYNAQSAGTASVSIGVNALGNLTAARTGTVVDPTNGDFIALILYVSDQIKT